MNELQKPEELGGTGEPDTETRSAAEQSPKPDSAQDRETGEVPDQAADPESGGAAGVRSEEEKGAWEEAPTSPKEEPGVETPGDALDKERAEAVETESGVDTEIAAEAEQEQPREAAEEPAPETETEQREVAESPQPEPAPETEPEDVVAEEAAAAPKASSAVGAPPAEEETAEMPAAKEAQEEAAFEPEPVAKEQAPEEETAEAVTQEVAEDTAPAEEETAEMPAAEDVKEAAPAEAEPEPAAEEQVPEEKPADTVPQEVAESAPAVEEETAAPPAPEAEKEEAPAEAPKTAGVPGIDWYIIHTYSGFENKVKESLRTRAEAFGFSDRIGEILIPTEDVVEMKSGKKVTSKRLLYPGYVLVQLKMDDELWHVVKNTPRVTGFVGSGPTPTPLTADEVNQILFRQTASAEKPRPKLTFERNDRVRIIDGPFTNFTGTVEEVHPERNMLRVMVTIFGRETPVELEHFQVEKEKI